MGNLYILKFLLFNFPKFILGKWLSIFLFNLEQKDGGTKPYSVEISTPMAVSLNEMAEDVRSVLKSIIKQDGRFTTREAGVVGKLYGAELSRMKMQVDIHKINSRISSKQTTADQVLTLT